MCDLKLKSSENACTSLPHEDEYESTLTKIKYMGSEVQDSEVSDRQISKKVS